MVLVAIPALSVRTSPAPVPWRCIDPRSLTPPCKGFCSPLEPRSHRPLHGRPKAVRHRVVALHPA